MVVSKMKQANKKWRHEQKRKQKAHREKMRKVHELERNAAKKHAKLDYLRNLGAEIQS